MFSAVGAFDVNLKLQELHWDIVYTSLLTSQSGTSLNTVNWLELHTGQAEIWNVLLTVFFKFVQIN